MKMKKYLILAVVSLVAIAGTAIGTGETQCPPLPEITDRLAFLTGVFFSEYEMASVEWSAIKDSNDLLTGIQGICVVVEEVNPQAQKYGLITRALQTDIELRLRQHRVKVFAEQERIRSHRESVIERVQQTFPQFKKLFMETVQAKSDQHFLQSVRGYLQQSRQRLSLSADLYIRLNVIINEERGFAAYSIDVQLFEGASIKRNRRYSLTTVWRTGSVGFAPLSKLRDVREVVMDDIDEFINDYLAANPKVGTPASPSTTKPPQRGLISGIIYSENNPSALIGGSIAYEGDTIGGITIVKIYRDRVVFEKEGTEATIRWTQKIGEAPKANWE